LAGVSGYSSRLENILLYNMIKYYYTTGQKFGNKMYVFERSFG